LIELEIRNFRSVRRQRVRLAPLTVVYGPNGSGKSSLVYSLVVFRNLVLNPNRPVASLFSLGAVSLGAYEDVVYNHKIDERIGFGVKLSRGGATLVYDVDLGANEVRFRLRAEGKVNLELRVDAPMPYPLNQQARGAFSVDGSGFEVSWNGVTAQLVRAVADPKLNEKAQEIVGLLNSPVSELQKTDFALVARGFTKPQYDGSVPVGSLVVTEDELASLLARDIYFQGKVSVYLERIFGREFRCYSPPGTSLVHLLTVDKQTGLTVKLVNEGFGVNQTVWVLAKLLRDDARIVCVEEPEIHLHPRALSRLARVVADVVRRSSKRVVLVTHSEPLLISLLGSVARGELSPSDIMIYLAEVKRGETVFTPQEVNEKGQVRGGLASFIEAELEDIKAFLKVQP
jgi:energy-coupling factor transporter ATP-binding protein EcfA2